MNQEKFSLDAFDDAYKTLCSLANSLTTDTIALYVRTEKSVMEDVKTIAKRSLGHATVEGNALTLNCGNKTYSFKADKVKSEIGEELFESLTAPAVVDEPEEDAEASTVNPMAAFGFDPSKAPAMPQDMRNANPFMAMMSMAMMPFMAMFNQMSEAGTQSANNKAVSKPHSSKDMSEITSKLNDKIRNTEKALSAEKEAKEKLEDELNAVRIELQQAKDDRNNHKNNKADSNRIQELQKEVERKEELLTKTQNKLTEAINESKNLKKKMEELNKELKDAKANRSNDPETDAKIAYLSKLAYEDKLTGLPNGNKYSEVCKSLNPASYIMAKINITNMAQANEVYGEANGNSLIKAAVNALSSAFRNGDIYRTISVNFTLLVKDASAKDVEATLDELRAKLELDQIDIAYGVCDGREVKSVDEMEADCISKLHDMTSTSVDSMYIDDDIEDL